MDKEQEKPRCENVRPVCDPPCGGDQCDQIPSWQRRLLQERGELLERTIRLNRSFDDPSTMRLSAREWEMLRRQYASMREYLQALTDRCVYYKLIEAGDLGLHY